jgi:hypothetical protein
MDVLNPALCRIRRLTMTSNAEQQASTAAAPVQPPKATKRAHVAPHKRCVAPGKPRSRKKASAAQRRAKSQKAAKGAKSDTGAREGSKAAKVLDLLKRSGGVTLKELMKATGWQPHSIRGYLSGTVRKKMKLRVASAKGADGERHYSVKG